MVVVARHGAAYTYSPFIRSHDSKRSAHKCYAYAGSSSLKENVCVLNPSSVRRIILFERTRATNRESPSRAMRYIQENDYLSNVAYFFSRSALKVSRINFYVFTIARARLKDDLVYGDWIN